MPKNPGKGKGRGKKRDREVTPPRAEKQAETEKEAGGDAPEEREDVAVAVEAESQLEEASHELVAAEDVDTQLVEKAKKARREVVVISPELEDKLLQLIQEHPYLYNKKLNDYHNNTKKNDAWDAIGHTLSLDVKMLKNWYRSQRTAYGKLTQTKSGQGAIEYTERQEWLVKNMAFLQKHIARHGGKSAGLGSTPEKPSIPPPPSPAHEGSDHASTATSPSILSPAQSILEDIESRGTTPTTSVSRAKKVQRQESTELVELKKLSETQDAASKTLLQLIAQHQNKPPEPEDAATTYAKHLAEEMRAMTKNEFMEFKYRVGGIIYDIQKQRIQEEQKQLKIQQQQLQQQQLQQQQLQQQQLQQQHLYTFLAPQAPPVQRMTYYLPPNQQGQPGAQQNTQPKQQNTQPTQQNTQPTQQNTQPTQQNTQPTQQTLNQHSKTLNQHRVAKKLRSHKSYSHHKEQQ